MPGSLTIHSASPVETRELAEALGALLAGGEFICLYGDLGAGKTTFVQGMAKGLGVREEYITSPSFALVNEYAGRTPLYHIDLYRLSGPEDIEDIGFAEYPGDGVAAVEWPERAGDFLPGDRLEISIEYEGEGRRMNFMATGERHRRLLEAYAAAIGR